MNANCHYQCHCIGSDMIYWNENPSFLFSISSSGPFRDCFQVRQAGHSTSGMYLLKAEGSDRLIQAWCEHKLDNGGWTVFQRRKDGSVNFFRNWENYKVKAHNTLTSVCCRHAKLRQSISSELLSFLTVFPNSVTVNF